MLKHIRIWSRTFKQFCTVANPSFRLLLWATWVHTNLCMLWFLCTINAAPTELGPPWLMVFAYDFPISWPLLGLILNVLPYNLAIIPVIFLALNLTGCLYWGLLLIAVRRLYLYLIDTDPRPA